MDLHIVLGFFYSRLNWDSPTPLTRRRVCPPFFGWGAGGIHSLVGEGARDSQFRQGDRHCGTLGTTASHLIPGLVTRIQDHVLLLIGVVPEQAELLVIISDFQTVKCYNRSRNYF
jgi:hypothetical protein